jgi:hypothetical protein
MYVGCIVPPVANVSVTCKRYPGILLSFVSEASRLLYGNADVVSSFNNLRDKQARGRQTSSSTPSPQCPSCSTFSVAPFLNSLLCTLPNCHGRPLVATPLVYRTSHAGGICPSRYLHCWGGRRCCCRRLVGPLKHEFGHPLLGHGCPSPLLALYLLSLI